MKLALGTVQFGLPYGIANQVGKVSRTEAKLMLQLAGVYGIDMIDTAIAYGDSENCLGESGLKKFKIVTKLPSVPDSCTDISAWVQGQIAASLMRLGVSKVYGLLLHKPMQLLGSDGKILYQTLKYLKEIGLVEKIGISIYSPNELEEITRLYRIDLVQAPFNLVDQRLHTTGWLQRLKNEGVEVHTRSVFLQGLLLMPQVDIPKKFEPWNELWCRWHKWLSEHRVTAVQACLTFPLSFSEIDRVVVGADNVIQLEQIINATNSIGDDDLPDLSCDAENLINPGCWPKL